ncbi:uncharacterized protein LOC128132290 [Lactuca sativa]|uniref:GRF-type domain-containing protein n=1 Tax=Lactuca sativa TaxID=4236 RepID=A0A9R1WFL8_LACSA|nr:uncharacterized protein LOC128132290 [Lactuca sativa]KAJ0221907.1 hypothetical protein LSAT_V11C200056450 [Lactuca sativa]
MSTSSAKSSFQGGPTLTKKRIVRCGCGDVCKVSVARTPENYGKKFYGCPNYKVEEEDCGFFKWYNEEDGHIIDLTHTKQKQGQGQGHGQLKTLVEIIVGLLVLIFVMVTILAFGRMFELTWLLVFSCKWKYNTEVG